MSPRATLAIMGVAFLFVLMPFLFWQASWFGRPLTDEQLSRYLGDTDHPRNAQHGLVQLSGRIERRQPGVERWYPQVVALGTHPEIQVRLTAAWVMGLDNKSPEFHQALLGLLTDSDPMVRTNAALSLVRHADASGRAQIHSMLEPQMVVAPQSGVLSQRLKVEDVVRPGTLIGHVNTPQGKVEVRSAVPGKLERWLASDGASVSVGQSIVVLSPSPEVAWEALRALCLIGQPEDLPIVERFARATSDMPPNIQKQAALTLQAIHSRSGS